jgi:hypothetical protein
MKLHFKEDPREWRKMTLLGLIGPTVLTGVLAGFDAISWMCASVVWCLIAFVAVCAVLRPTWFRRHYRFMTWIGFHIVRLFGCVVLGLIFFFIVTPMGWLLRLARKDLLDMKWKTSRHSFWVSARPKSSLEELF